MRSKNTYVILRELHKWEKDENVLVALEHLVNIIIKFVLLISFFPLLFQKQIYWEDFIFHLKLISFQLLTLYFKRNQ